MAQAALTRSDRPVVLRLARAIIASQQSEMDAMQDLLRRKGLAPEPEAAPMPAGMVMDAANDPTGAGLTLARTLIRLLPLPVAAAAAAWLGVDTVRRRRADRLAGAPTGPFVSPWGVLAIGGLAIAAALYFGLAPARFAAAPAYGVFSVVAGATLAIVAGALLAWPTRPAFLAGLLLLLALIVVWGGLRIGLLSGAGAVADGGRGGLVTTVVQLIAALGCSVAWWRSRPNLLAG